MTTATLSGAPATQLTFPWVQADDEATIVAKSPVSPNAGAEITEVAPSLTDALEGDRIGRPFKMGSVMFRLLKSYGITDEEIAAGVAAYNARKGRRP